MQYFPITPLFFLTFWVLFVLLIALVEVGILRYVFDNMGVSRRYMFLFLVCHLLGSYINIPVAEQPAQQVESNEIVEYFGMHYIVPVVVTPPRTIVAVNVGGAVMARHVDGT